MTGLLLFLVLMFLNDHQRPYAAPGRAPLDAPVVRPLAGLAWAGVALAALITGLGLFLLATGHGA